MRSWQHKHLPGSVSPVYQPLWPITNTAAPSGGGGTLLPSQATGKKVECNLGHEAFFLLVTVSEETSWPNQDLIRSLLQLPSPFSFSFIYSPSLGLSRLEEIYHKAEAASSPASPLAFSLSNTGDGRVSPNKGRKERSVPPCSL